MIKQAPVRCPCGDQCVYRTRGVLASHPVACASKGERRKRGNGSEGGGGGGRRQGWEGRFVKEGRK